MNEYGLSKQETDLLKKETEHQIFSALSALESITGKRVVGLELITVSPVTMFGLDQVINVEIILK